MVAVLAYCHVDQSHSADASAKPVAAGSRQYHESSRSYVPDRPEAVEAAGLAHSAFPTAGQAALQHRFGMLEDERLEGPGRCADSDPKRLRCARAVTGL